MSAAAIVYFVLSVLFGITLVELGFNLKSPGYWLLTLTAHGMYLCGARS